MIPLYNKVYIDLSALKHNLNQVKSLLPSEKKIMAIVKSDAYGHGLVPVSNFLDQNGVFSFGVSYLNEAIELRNHGISRPIIILCGISSAEECDLLFEKDLTPVVFNQSCVELIAQASSIRNKQINVQIKLDTGMGRLGIPVSDTRAFIEKIKNYKLINIQGLMSHLSSADETGCSFTNEQIKKFRQAVETGRSMGLELPLNSLAGSAGIMGYKESHFDMIRPGIMLYGGSSSPNFHPKVSLKPVMSLRCRVLQVRDLPKQTPVSYGRTYITKRDQKIAVISAGYGDGIPRAISEKGMILIKGQKAKVVGRICMNMTMCDITGINDNIAPGDEAVPLGKQGDNTITGDDIAAWGDTISYEIFCSIGQKNIKEYLR
ncbi:MAG: alanine racemase [Deltaproteobacteria bacterium]|nr:alanine racemase [Deltaproteobacteria bacterium]